ncbi:MAG: hypothetical protein CVU87_05425 [Firmicutes bacterium HGW-Firmicutes-12]|jgi:putative tricarboxylic transport membrane protein|nr:MAG: hypothetical protein CVU87_05425 [Firmicutes bacterium HGW-Firmicutes-12]
MSFLGEVISSIPIVLQPFNLLVTFIGVLVGITFGAVPGIGAPLAMTMFLPMAFGMDPIPCLLILLGLYFAALYGGSISSILINAPGTPASIATSYDGYPMSQKGEAGIALNTSVVSSMFGGFFSIIVFILFFNPLNELFIEFGPSQLFVFVFISFVFLTMLDKTKWDKVIVATCVGLLLGMVGQDLISGSIRYTFGYIYIEDGLDLIAVLTAWFAVTEVLFLIGKKEGSIATDGILKGSPLQGVKNCFKYPVTLIRSSIIGCVVGIIPGVGGSVANVAAYSAAKSSSKHPELFGTGYAEGVVAPEAANNAVSATSLIPTLALGIPGSAPAAIILGALLMLGYRPGPGLASTDPGLIPALIAGMITVNILFCIVGLSLTNTYKKITQVNIKILIPLIISLSLLGGYLSRFRISDVFFALLLGVFAYGTRKAKYPVTPMVLGFLLATMIEENFFKSLLISDNGALIFIQGPINIFLVTVGILIICWQPLKKFFSNITSSN